MRDKIKAFMDKTADFRTPEQQAKYEELRGRRGNELKLWQRWDESGRKHEHLQPLLKSINPLITSEAKKRQAGLGGSIPMAALKQELQTAALRGIQSFDPSRGVPLTNHVAGNFRRISDFVAANRNERYMPREDVDTYQAFQNAKNELHEELGREPTSEEIATRLPGWTLQKVKKMGRGFGAEVYTDMGTEFDGSVARMGPRDAYLLMKSKMHPDEQRFAELAFPHEGPSHNVKQIAKQLNISTDKAYRLKAKVERRLAGVLKNE